MGSQARSTLHTFSPLFNSSSCHVLDYMFFLEAGGDPKFNFQNVQCFDRVFSLNQLRAINEIRAY